ncbi:MAG: ABC transporter permease [Planctomycetes bacterium]|nr:ABC transporter permease [Planctomycetota bacterium]MBI3847323.1 ABC transporter permease [Planctomycetota bacterium]
MKSLLRRFVLVRENVSLAVGTLVDNRFRSFLTILGVFIGVIIVVGVASVLNGFRQSVVDQVEEFGTNNIYVYRFPFVQTGRLPREIRMRRPLKHEDAVAIGELCPSVQTVSVGLQIDFGVTAKYRGEEMQGPHFRGVPPDDERVSHSTIKEGRWFTESESQHRADVCVIAHNVTEALFPNESPVDKSIEVSGHRFRVIGCTEKLKEGPFGQDNQEDSVIRVPYDTFRKYYPNMDDHFIVLEARSGQLDRAVEEVTQLLRRRRGVRWDEDNDFEVGTANSLIESFDKIVFATLAVMFVLSTVAFIVGGVGVMNIMLVSVTERTKEIGLRKSIGARKADIVQQFLTEAVLLTGTGGVLGLVLGELLMNGLALIAPTLPVATPMWGRAFAFVGSVTVGVVFGMWPAMKAARLDPIEALRYE